MDESREEKYKPTVGVYDADFLPYYICHNKKDEPEKTLEECYTLVDNFIDNINQAIEAEFYCGFLTVGKCFRYTIYPDYKANRKYEQKLNYLDRVKEYLITKHNFTYLSGYEADDLVVSFKRQYVDFKSIIVSPDKDILYSVDVAYNPRKNEFVHNYPEDISKYFWTSMITGDTTDNIKGIPGKGPAAAKSIYEFGKVIKHPKFLAGLALTNYIEHFGEVRGIEEFYKNFKCLNLVNTVVLDDVKLNKIEKIEFSE